MGRGGGGRLFEAGRILTFSAFRMGAYSRWALIQGGALIKYGMCNKVTSKKDKSVQCMVKEVKVKDFAVLFLALSWFHQGNHKKLSFNISKSTLINFR